MRVNIIGNFEREEILSKNGKLFNVKTNCYSKVNADVLKNKGYYKSEKSSEKSDYEKINYYLEKIKNGNSYFENDLIVELEPLIKKKCKYYFGYLDEDLLQMGRMKLLILIRSFDFEKTEIKFLGYIEKFISYYYLDLKRGEVKKSDREFSTDFTNLSENDVLYNEKGFANIHIEDTLAKLPEKEKMIIEKNVIHQEKIETVANDMNLSKEQVKYLKKKALNRLKKYF